MIELSESEKKFLALAIQGIALRQGPPFFNLAVSVSKKLGVEDYLSESLQSWIEYGERKREQGGKVA